MFTFKLAVARFSLRGFAALDFLRRFGLREAGHACSEWRVGFDLASFPADEAFARTWFDGAFSGGEASVEADWLAPGELEVSHVDTGGHMVAVRLVRSLDPARARELYVRARFAALEAKLAERETIDALA